MPKHFCEENQSKIAKFFKEAFSLAQVYYKKNAKIDLVQLDDIEASMVSSFQAFVIKLNED